MMMKKQVVSCFGLYLLLLNSFSFSMQPAGGNDQNPLAYEQFHVIPPAHGGQNQAEAEDDNNPPGYDQLQNIIPVQNMNELAHLDREEAQTMVDNFPSMKKFVIAYRRGRHLLQEENRPQEDRLPFAHSFLAYGPSASGKITLFRAMATLLGLPIGIVYPAYAMDLNRPTARPSFGERIEPFLQEDQQRFLIIKHIDKMKAFNRFEGDNAAATLASFLRVLEEEEDRGNNRLILAATAHKINDVPEELRQFFHCFEVKNPDLTRRTAILKNLLESNGSVRVNARVYNDEFIKSVTRKMEGFSIENLKRVSGATVLFALARAEDQGMDYNSVPELEKEELEEAFDMVYPYSEAARKEREKIAKEKEDYERFSQQCYFLRRWMRELRKPEVYRQQLEEAGE